MGTRSQISVQGRRLEVLDLDDAPAGQPAIVLLHEGLGSIGLWRGFPGALRHTTGLRTVAYSRFGHGQSDRPRRAPGTDFMHREARDILPEVLEAIGVCRPILVGHSDGGSISLIHAAEHDVLAVIALAPHVFVEEVCLDAISKLKSTYHSSGLRDRMARHHHDPDVTFSGWADVWLDPVFRSWHLADLLPEIAAPLLVIQGAEDQYGTLAQIDVIQSLVSAPMERLVVPGGHAPHIEQPETVLGAIAHFIRQATD